MKLFLSALLVFFTGYLFAQNVGIGTTDPLEKLHVAGNIKGDTAKMNGLRISANAGVGKVLTSDINGNASWQVSNIAKAANGLSKRADSILLGGRLSDSTTFFLSGKKIVFSDNDGVTQSVMASVTTFGSFTTLSATPLTQKFKAGFHYLLKSVELNFNSLPFSAVALEIKDNNGTVVGAANFSSSVIVSGWQVFTFMQPLSLTANESYSLSVTGTSGTQLFYNDTNPYPDGEASLGANTDLGFIIKVLQENNFMSIKNNRVGIGTVNPDTTLHIAGKVKITDGSQGTGKIFTSDAAGIGSWRPVSDQVIGGWGTNGNAGISANNFIGTTDNAPLQFRINNLHAGKIDSSGASTFLGFLAGSNSTRDSNTAIGYKSLLSNTTGSQNSSVGANALRNNTTGFNNSALGTESLYSNTTGTFNTGIGWHALRSNTSGTANSAIGEALEYNSTGSYNTGIGHGALYLNTTADANTAVGAFAMLNNTTGGYNAALGMEALRNNTTGSSNTAIGSRALYANTFRGYNTAIGAHTLLNNTGGQYNTAIGSEALNLNTIGSDNTALGSTALAFNTVGGGNIALGGITLVQNTSGNYNVASGYNALGRNTTGSYNVASGYIALSGNKSGEGNVGIGYWTLSLNEASNYNTAVGNEAGRGFAQGWNNTFLGAFSNAGTGIFNSIAIGANAVAFASNQVRIGNSSTTSIGGYAGWTNVSDGRFKKNIKEDVRGLDFIMQLRPVTYQLDITGLRKKLNEPDEQLKESKMDLAIAEKESMIQSGFVAQEVEAAAKKMGYDFSGVDKPKNESDLYGLRYAEFVVPLVKAVQEQQKQMEELKKEVNRLKDLGNRLTQLLATLNMNQ